MFHLYSEKEAILQALAIARLRAGYLRAVLYDQDLFLYDLDFGAIQSPPAKCWSACYPVHFVALCQGKACSVGASEAGALGLM